MEHRDCRDLPFQRTWANQRVCGDAVTACDRRGFTRKDIPDSRFPAASFLSGFLAACCIFSTEVPFTTAFSPSCQALLVFSAQKAARFAGEHKVPLQVFSDGEQLNRKEGDQ